MSRKRDIVIGLCARLLNNVMTNTFNYRSTINQTVTTMQLHMLRNYLHSDISSTS